MLEIRIALFSLIFLAISIVSIPPSELPITMEPGSYLIMINKFLSV